MKDSDGEYDENDSEIMVLTTLMTVRLIAMLIVVIIMKMTVVDDHNDRGYNNT